MSHDNQKRLEIVQQAYRVFFKEGFHAAGVDTVLEGSGISKRTLYKYFDSKEDLIAAAVEHYRELSFERIRSFVEAQKNDHEKPLAIFDWLAAVRGSGHRLGCFAINAKLEYANRETKIEAVCDLHFARVEDYLASLCREAGYDEPKLLARQLHLLMQGAIVSGMTSRGAAAIKAARLAAIALLDSASR